jgi:hypothetical protein
MGRALVKETMVTQSKRALLFGLLDQYARTNHQCFVAEMDPIGESESEFRVCFRATNDSVNPDIYACRYLEFASAEFEPLPTGGVLPLAVVEKLDNVLRPLGYPKSSR